MLVLARKPGESIEVDGPAKITFVKFRGHKAAVLSITAPASTQVIRSEIVGRSPEEDAARHAARMLDAQTIADAAIDAEGAG
jgi:carbon storage regulator CsrA